MTLGCHKGAFGRLSVTTHHHHHSGLPTSELLPKKTPNSGLFGFCCPLDELELELIQTQMAQKPMLRAEVGMRVRCANKASAE